MPVADSVVSRYRNRGVATEDLQQVAYLALTKATRRFDPGAGHDFLSFCVPTIRGEVRRYFRDKGWMVRPPRRIQELQQRLGSARTDLTASLGRPPTPDELARHLEERPADIREALDGQGCFTPDVLDRTVSDERARPRRADRGRRRGPGGRRSTGDARSRRTQAQCDVTATSCELRFYEGLTQREIAEDIGVTQMQVSRCSPASTATCAKSSDPARSATQSASARLLRVGAQRLGKGYRMATTPPSASFFAQVSQDLMQIGEERPDAAERGRARRRGRPRVRLGERHAAPAAQPHRDRGGVLRHRHARPTSSSTTSRRARASRPPPPANHGCPTGSTTPRTGRAGVPAPRRSASTHSSASSCPPATRSSAR